MSQNRMLHPEDGMVYACPECNSSAMRERANPDVASIAPGSLYVCYSCKSGVEKPIERESKEKSNFDQNVGCRKAKGGLARKLEQMDPDEVGA